MRSMWRPFLFSLLLSSTASADALHTCEHCSKLLMPAPSKITPGRKYARDRRVDIQHLMLDVTPDFAKRTIAGTMTLRFKPIALPLDQLVLDAVDLDIQEIKVTGAELADRILGPEQLTLVFTKPIAPNTDTTVQITYKAEPEKGLYFRTPEMGYKPGDTQVWSQGEPDFHRSWFPCYDYPNERFTSEVICHVPKGMEVVSNGRLLGTQEKGELTTWHWLQDKPHVNYLVALAAGYFHKLEDKAGDLPLALLVPPSHKDQAANAFADTRKIIEFFQKETGVAFPWDKYYQVFCHDFLIGGMENTSCTFEASSLLFNSDTETLRSLHWLDAHETAHQWFGDLLTCRDWSHLWLNEGFASYYTVLYEQAKNGDDAAKLALWQEAEEVFDSKDTRPTVWRDYGDPMQQFDSRVYPKGAWILHMIRSQLGTELYRKAITLYLERHRNGIVSTDDLHDVLEEVSGFSFDAFFDQWLYHGGYPELKADYSWDATTKQVKLTVQQKQKTSDQVRLFQFTLPVSFTVKGQKEPLRFTARISQAEESFYFALPAQPELLRLDPDYTLLATFDFTPPADMLKKQLQGDLIGRLLATQILGKRQDQTSVDRLAKLAKDDAFHAVRSEAAKALAKIATPAARAALIAALQAPQPEARARRSIVESLARLPHPEAQEALLKHSQVEKNPMILAAIIKSWGTRPGVPAIKEALLQKIGSQTYQNIIAAAAIQAARDQDEPAYVPAILKKLQDDTLEFRSRDYTSAMDALAFLARRQDSRDQVREFLIQHLSHPKQDLRTAAAKSLGTLRDPKALPVLQAMLPGGGPHSDPVREAAAKSVPLLQAEQTGSAELKNLWEQLQQTQKSTEALRKELDEAQKKFAPAKAQ